MTPTKQEQPTKSQSEILKAMGSEWFKEMGTIIMAPFALLANEVGNSPSKPKTALILAVGFPLATVAALALAAISISVMVLTIAVLSPFIVAVLLKQANSWVPS